MLGGGGSGGCCFCFETESLSIPDCSAILEITMKAGSDLKAILLPQLIMCWGDRPESSVSNLGKESEEQSTAKGRRLTANGEEGSWRTPECSIP